MRYVGSRVGPVRALFYFPYIFPLSSLHLSSFFFSFLLSSFSLQQLQIPLPFETKASMRGSRRVRRTIRVLIPSRFVTDSLIQTLWFATALFILSWFVQHYHSFGIKMHGWRLYLPSAPLSRMYLGWKSSGSEQWVICLSIPIDNFEFHPWSFMQKLNFLIQGMRRMLQWGLEQVWLMLRTRIAPKTWAKSCKCKTVP